VRELVADPANRWIPYEEINVAEVHKQVPVQASLRLHGGGVVQLKESWTGEQIGRSRDVLLEVLASFGGRG